VKTTKWVVLMQVGMWLGYVTFGYVSDRFGRKRAYITYLFVAAAIVPVYGAASASPITLLLLGPFVAFFGTGYFVGFGVLSAELFPTHIRATAQGLTYNVGRAVSAAAPTIVGSLAAQRGLGFAFRLVSVAFLGAALLAFLLPETRGREIGAD
jgi:MFS family permease